MKHLIPFILLVLFFVGAGQFFLPSAAISKKQVLQQQHSFEHLKTGDLICRYGTDIISYMLQQYNPRKKWYSHCGLLIDSNNKYWVIHIMGNGGLRMDAIEAFCDQAVAKEVGIFRYTMADSIRHQIADKARALLHQSIQFDYDFNLQTSNQLYCSELVWTLLPSSIQQAVVIDSYQNKPICFIDALHDSLIAKPIWKLKN